MIQDIEIKTIPPDDAETLRQCASLVTEHSWGPDFPLQPFDEALRAEYHVCARTNGAVVGYANVNRFASPDGKDNGEMWFAQVVVDPKNRQRGILTEMYEKCLAHMQENSGRILAGTDNPIMEKFFVAHGWQHLRNTLDEAGDPCHILEYPNRRA